MAVSVFCEEIMPIWIYWAAAIVVADLLIIAFVHGADTRRDHPEWN